MCEIAKNLLVFITTIFKITKNNIVIIQYVSLECISLITVKHHN